MFRIAKKFWFLVDSTSQQENYCIHKSTQKSNPAGWAFMVIGAGVGQAGFVFLMRQNLFWRYLCSTSKQMNYTSFDASTGTR